MVAVDGSGNAKRYRFGLAPIGGTPQNKWALLIAIDDYEQLRPDLRCAENDAKRVAEILKNPARGDFAPDQVFKLLGSQARKERIEDILGDIATRAKPDDLFVLFFSGHGNVFDGQAILELWNTRPAPPERRLRESLISLELHRLVDALPMRKKVYLLDCCHAAAVEGPADGGSSPST